MGMQLPEWIGTLFQVMTGDGWPEADEDDLRELAREWSGVAEVTTALKLQLEEPVRAGRRTSWDGPGADAFNNASFALSGPGSQQVTALAQSSEELSAFIKDTSTNVEYMKLIVLGQLVILAGQIAYLTSMAWVTFGASTAAVPALQAAGRAIAVTAVRQLLVSIAVGQTLQVGMDATIQALQKFVLHTRRDWNTDLTSSAAITGAVGGALGPAMGVLGAIASKAIMPMVGRSIAGAIEQVGVSAVHEFSTSVGTGLVTRQGFIGTPWDLTAGAIDGATDAAGHLLRGRRGGAGLTTPDTTISVPLIDDGHGGPTVDTGSGQGSAIGAPPVTFPSTQLSGDSSVARPVTAPGTGPQTTSPQSTSPQTTSPQTTSPQTTSPQTTGPQSTAGPANVGAVNQDGGGPVDQPAHDSGPTSPLNDGVGLVTATRVVPDTAPPATPITVSVTTPSMVVGAVDSPTSVGSAGRTPHRRTSPPATPEISEIQLQPQQWAATAMASSSTSSPFTAAGAIDTSALNQATVLPILLANPDEPSPDDSRTAIVKEYEFGIDHQAWKAANEAQRARLVVEVIQRLQDRSAELRRAGESDHQAWLQISDPTQQSGHKLHIAADNIGEVRAALQRVMPVLLRAGLAVKVARREDVLVRTGGRGLTIYLPRRATMHRDASLVAAALAGYQTTAADLTGETPLAPGLFHRFEFSWDPGADVSLTESPADFHWYSKVLYVKRSDEAPGANRRSPEQDRTSQADIQRRYRLGDDDLKKIAGLTRLKNEPARVLEIANLYCTVHGRPSPSRGESWNKQQLVEVQRVTNWVRKAYPRTNLPTVSLTTDDLLGVMHQIEGPIANLNNYYLTKLAKLVKKYPRASAKELETYARRDAEPAFRRYIANTVNFRTVALQQVLSRPGSSPTTGYTYDTADIRALVSLMVDQYADPRTSRSDRFDLNEYRPLVHDVLGMPEATTQDLAALADLVHLVRTGQVSSVPNRAVTVHNLRKATAERPLQPAHQVRLHAAPIEIEMRALSQQMYVLLASNTIEQAQQSMVRAEFVQATNEFYAARTRLNTADPDGRGPLLTAMTAAVQRLQNLLPGDPAPGPRVVKRVHRTVAPAPKVVTEFVTTPKVGQRHVVDPGGSADTTPRHNASADTTPRRKTSTDTTPSRTTSVGTTPDIDQIRSVLDRIESGPATSIDTYDVDARSSDVNSLDSVSEVASSSHATSTGIANNPLANRRRQLRGQLNRLEGQLDPGTGRDFAGDYARFQWLNQELARLTDDTQLPQIVRELETTDAQQELENLRPRIDRVLELRTEADSVEQDLNNLIQQDLAAQGLALVQVEPGPDSLWNSLILAADQRIRTTLGSAYLGPRPFAVTLYPQLIRQFVADRVQSQASTELVTRIRSGRTRTESETNVMLELAARELGLSLTVIAPGQDAVIGIENGYPARLVRAGDDFSTAIPNSTISELDTELNARGKLLTGYSFGRELAAESREVRARLVGANGIVSGHALLRLWGLRQAMTILEQVGPDGPNLETQADQMKAQREEFDKLAAGMTKVYRQQRLRDQVDNLLIAFAQARSQADGDPDSAAFAQADQVVDQMRQLVTALRRTESSAAVQATDQAAGFGVHPIPADEPAVAVPQPLDLPAGESASGPQAPIQVHRMTSPGPEVVTQRLESPDVGLRHLLDPKNAASTSTEPHEDTGSMVTGLADPRQQIAALEDDLKDSVDGRSDARYASELERREQAILRHLEGLTTHVDKIAKHIQRLDTAGTPSGTGPDPRGFFLRRLDEYSADLTRLRNELRDVQQEISFVGLRMERSRLLESPQQPQPDPEQQIDPEADDPEIADLRRRLAALRDIASSTAEQSDSETTAQASSSQTLAAQVQDLRARVAQLNLRSPLIWRSDDAVTDADDDARHSVGEANSIFSDEFPTMGTSIFPPIQPPGVGESSRFSDIDRDNQTLRLRLGLELWNAHSARYSDAPSSEGSIEPDVPVLLSEVTATQDTRALISTVQELSPASRVEAVSWLRDRRDTLLQRLEELTEELGQHNVGRHDQRYVANTQQRITELGTRISIDSRRLAEIDSSLQQYESKDKTSDEPKNKTFRGYRAPAVELLWEQRELRISLQRSRSERQFLEQDLLAAPLRAERAAAQNELDRIGYGLPATAELLVDRQLHFLVQVADVNVIAEAINSRPTTERGLAIDRLFARRQELRAALSELEGVLDPDTGRDLAGDYARFQWLNEEITRLADDTELPQPVRAAETTNVQGELDRLRARVERVLWTYEADAVGQVLDHLILPSLAAQRLTLVRMEPGPDSLWNSLILAADQRIRTTLGSAYLGLRPFGVTLTPELVRRFVADRVHWQASSELLTRIRVGETGNEHRPILELAARELGLSLTLMEPGQDTVIGIENGYPARLIREGVDFSTAIPTSTISELDTELNARRERLTGHSYFPELDTTANKMRAGLVDEYGVVSGPALLGLQESLRAMIALEHAGSIVADQARQMAQQQTAFAALVARWADEGQQQLLRDHAADLLHTFDQARSQANGDPNSAAFAQADDLIVHLRTLVRNLRQTESATAAQAAAEAAAQAAALANAQAAAQAAVQVNTQTAVQMAVQPNAPAGGIGRIPVVDPVGTAETAGTAGTGIPAPRRNPSIADRLRGLGAQAVPVPNPRFLAPPGRTELDRAWRGRTTAQPLELEEEHDFVTTGYSADALTAEQAATLQQGQVISLDHSASVVPRQGDLPPNSPVVVEIQGHVTATSLGVVVRPGRKYDVVSVQQTQGRTYVRLRELEV